MWKIALMAVMLLVSGCQNSKDLMARGYVIGYAKGVNNGIHAEQKNREDLSTFTADDWIFYLVSEYKTPDKLAQLSTVVNGDYNRFYHVLKDIHFVAEDKSKK